MKVEVWSDVVCPWCYIGKRRLAATIERFEHAEEVEVVWRSFELSPDAPPVVEGSLAEYIAAKNGTDVERVRRSNEKTTRRAASDGLELRLDIAKRGNTFDAHRLLHLAAARGLADALEERLFEAYLTQGLPIGERDTLKALATEVGLTKQEVVAALESDDFASEVRDDEQTARDLGITGVPTFVVEGTHSAYGAQSVEALLELLQDAWAHRPITSESATDETPGDGLCDNGVCAI